MRLSKFVATTAGGVFAILMTEPARAQSSRVSIGLGAVSTPAYQGSDESRLLPVPLVDVQVGRFFASSANGVGVNLIQTPTFNLGASIVPVPGYRRRDVPEGIGRLADAAGGRVFASAGRGPLRAELGATRSIGGGTRGAIVDGRFSSAFPVNARLTLIPSISATWADKKQMNGYFGITARQAAASGLARYTAGKGFKDVSTGVTARYQFSERVSLISSVGATRLLGNAADSPIVERRWLPTGLVGASYSF
jgi:outer membrane protein